MPLVKHPTLSAQKLVVSGFESQALWCRHPACSPRTQNAGWKPAPQRLRSLAAALYKTCLKTSTLPKLECPLNSMGTGATSICAKQANQAKASLFSDLAATLGKTC